MHSTEIKTAVARLCIFCVVILAAFGLNVACVKHESTPPTGQTLIQYEPDVMPPRHKNYFDFLENNNNAGADHGSIPLPDAFVKDDKSVVPARTDGLSGLIDEVMIEEVSRPLAVMSLIVIFIFGCAIVLFAVFELLHGIIAVPAALLSIKKNLRDNHTGVKTDIHELNTRLDSIEDKLLKLIADRELTPNDLDEMDYELKRGSLAKTGNPVPQSEDIVSDKILNGFDEPTPLYPPIIDELIPFTDHSLSWDEAVVKTYALGDPDKYRLVFRSKNNDYTFESDIPMRKETITQLLSYLNYPLLSERLFLYESLGLSPNEQDRAVFSVYSTQVDLNGHCMFGLWPNSMDAAAKYTSDERWEMLRHYFQFEDNEFKNH